MPAIFLYLSYLFFGLTFLVSVQDLSRGRHHLAHHYDSPSAPFKVGIYTHRLLIAGENTSIMRLLAPLRHGRLKPAQKIMDAGYSYSADIWSLGVIVC